MVVVVVAFSSLARILEESSTIHSLPAPFFFSGFFFCVCVCVFFFVFFFEVEISSRTLIPLFMPGSVYSGSAS